MGSRPSYQIPSALAAAAALSTVCLLDTWRAAALVALTAAAVWVTRLRFAAYAALALMLAGALLFIYGHSVSNDQPPPQPKGKERAKPNAS